MFDMTGIGKPFGEMLKSYGIYINGGVYQNFYGYFGGRKQGSAGQGEYTLGADLDLKQMFGIPGAAIHISTNSRSGENPSRFTGAGIVSTANYGPTASYRLGELSWDQDLFNDHVRILVGRIADNIDFAGSELYCRFLFSTCGQVERLVPSQRQPELSGSELGRPRHHQAEPDDLSALRCLSGDLDRGPDQPHRLAW